ncbi:hypothetical protein L2E82_45708 [Cichorium intybus]|uniref:Uncharacterized protein n=1 Tax=Cichorium intybus TaxID=13427 RepID=A0ACB8ZY46_CICIN|nr:hypothetical protein L2E82_45708 [Cichorium intybus]
MSTSPGLNRTEGMDCSEFGSVAEVLRIKKIVDKSRDESKSESATGIGKTVSPLKKHASENVRRISVRLVKGWKGTVNEWFDNQSSVDCLVKPTNVKLMNTGRKLGVSEKPANILNGGGRDSSEKLEATKRKLREAYLAVENMKKKPRIQVMELHEVAK